FSSRRRHTRFSRDWSSDVCSSDLLQRPGVAVRAREHGSGFLVIAFNIFFRRVPINLAAQAAGDVRQVADGGRTVADLHVADRQLSRFDAVKKIAVVAFAFVQVYVAVGERLFDDLFRRAHQLAAVDFDAALFADERGAAGDVFLALAND